MDRLLLRAMSFYGYHGDVAAERELGGRYTVDVEIGVDLVEAARSDSLEAAVDYVHVYQLVREVVEEQQHRLLESMAEAIAGRILPLPRVREVRVRVGKVPPVAGSFGEFAVEIVRPAPGTP
ncbi:MAG TPA: dihydroneopterin aldolase [Candidatus Dormibacteraeota bacterium]|jgi:dihydroneopterin aldolase